MIPLPVHPLCTMSPDMASDQYEEFKADIAANGQREPVKVWRGQIIDGRHRARACGELDQELLTTDVEMVEDALPGYVLSLNALRSHLTPSQRAMYAASVANRTHGYRGQDRVSTQLGTYSPPTIEEAARAIGSSKTAVIEAKRIQRDAAPAVSEAVRAGRLTLHAAGRIMEAAPVDAQPALVERVLSENRGKGKQRVVAIAGGRVRKPPTRREALEALIERALTQVDVACEAIAAYGERARPTNEQAAEWTAVLERTSTVIRRFRTILKGLAA